MTLNFWPKAAQPAPKLLPASCQVPDNERLSETLCRIGEQGFATAADVAEIKARAGRLSSEEATAVWATVRGVRMEDTDRTDLVEYMLAETATRGDHMEHLKRRGDALQIGALVATAVAVPVLNHVLPFTGIQHLGDITNAAANAVQIALIAGEYATGWFASRAIKRHYAEEAKSYGRDD